jgi:hypothetical protein
MLRCYTFSMIVLLAMLSRSTHAAIIISEVHSTGSSNLNYGSDWFELTNTGAAAVDITGWRMDDSSADFNLSALLDGVTSIAAGQSVVFVEDDATAVADMTNSWFGGNVPAGFTAGFYDGSGIGLSSAGDAVRIFDSVGSTVTFVTFGSATLGTSFDNSVGISGGAISTLSSVGVNGAFQSPDNEIGSPGVIAAVPEPGSVALLLAVSGTAYLRLRRRRVADKQ